LIAAGAAQDMTGVIFKGRVIVVPGVMLMCEMF
jgi:hypothetical protein